MNPTLTRENNVSDFLFVTDLSGYRLYETLPTLSSSDHNGMLVRLILYMLSRKSRIVREFCSINLNNVSSYLTQANISINMSANVMQELQS